MKSLVLQTKLYIPPARTADLVPRFRLIERLNEGLHRTPSVTLISAPTGFGKITLISEWLSGVPLFLVGVVVLRYQLG